MKGLESKSQIAVSPPTNSHFTMRQAQKAESQASDHPVLAAFVGLDAGQKLMELASAELEGKAEQTKLVRSVETLRLRIEAMSRIAKDQYCSVKCVQEFLACANSYSALIEKKPPNCEQLFDKLLKALQIMCGRIFKQHLKIECKNWVEIQVQVMKTSSKMSDVPGWPIFDIKGNSKARENAS